MTNIIVKIMVEVLNIFAIATKEIQQGRTSEFPACIGIGSADRFPEKYLKKLLGTKDIEDSLKRLDQLTQEEARMATAQLLKITHGIDDNVKDVSDTIKLVLDGTWRIIIFLLITP